MAEDKEILDALKGILVKAEDQERIRTDRFTSIYANNIRIGISAWDVSIIFGEIVDEKDGKPVIEELVQVKMTREITKVLAHLLAIHVRAYEEQTGQTISIPIINKATEDEQPAAVDATDKPPMG